MFAGDRETSCRRVEVACGCYLRRVGNWIVPGEFLTLLSPGSGTLTSNRRCPDANEDSGHDHARARCAARTERERVFRKRRALMDDELNPDDDAYANGWRRRPVGRAEARGRRRQPFHDRIPGLSIPGRGFVCDQGAGTHCADSRGAGERVYGSSARIFVRYADGDHRCWLPAIAGRGDFWRERVHAAEGGRPGNGVAGAFWRADLEEPGPGRSAARASRTRWGVSEFGWVQYHHGSGNQECGLRRGRDFSCGAAGAGNGVAADAADFAAGAPDWRIFATGRVAADGVGGGWSAAGRDCGFDLERGSVRQGIGNRD